MCPHNQLLGGTGMSEASEGLRAGSWSGFTGHSTCAWCWLLWGERVCIPHTPGVRGVCVGIH